MDENSQNNNVTGASLAIVEYANQEKGLQIQLVNSSTEMRSERVSENLKECFGHICTATARYSDNWLKFNQDLAKFLYSIHYRKPEIKDYDAKIQKILAGSIDEEKKEELHDYFEEIANILKDLQKNLEKLDVERERILDIQLKSTEKILNLFWELCEQNKKICLGQKQIAETSKKFHEKWDGKNQIGIGVGTAIVGGVVAIFTGGIASFLWGAVYGGISTLHIVEGVKEKNTSEEGIEKAKNALALQEDEIYKLDSLQRKWQKLFEEVFKSSKLLLQSISVSLAFIRSNLEESIKDLDDLNSKKKTILRVKWQNFFTNWTEISNAASFYVEINIKSAHLKK